MCHSAEIAKFPGHVTLVRVPQRRLVGSTYVTRHSSRGATAAVWLVVCGAAILLPLAAWTTEAWPTLTLLALVLFVIAVGLFASNTRIPS